MQIASLSPYKGKRIAAFNERPSRSERFLKGQALRRRCPRSGQAYWKAPKDRPSAIQWIRVSDKERVPELVPIRHGRMLQSPFHFYRGSALAMAMDLGPLAHSGTYVQACGDAHLGNFRCFATPERRVIFDIHDLDETLPAPWEWDVKRLCASFVIAARNNGLSDSRAVDLVQTCVRNYREQMHRFSQMAVLETWYTSFDVEKLIAKIKDPDIQARAIKRVEKALAQSALEYDFPKLVEEKNQMHRIKDNPPLIYHVKDHGRKRFTEVVQEAFVNYRNSLPEERRILLDHYQFKDMTVKVVGVGSVGTLCAIILLMADKRDPLFLQVKQAGESVLEKFAGKSLYLNHGQRVVQGHRLMQSASDVFLGWTKGRFNRHFYLRQLRDAKIKFAIETFGPSEFELFSKWCGTTLARAHARSSEPAVLAGYMGESDKFDRAIGKFSIAYADQVEKDYNEVAKAARTGKLKVVLERT